MPEPAKGRLGTHSEIREAGNKGLPVGFEHYPKALPIRPAKVGQERVYVNNNKGDMVKESPSYDKINAPKGIYEVPPQKGRKLIPLFQEIEETVIIT